MAKLSKTQQQINATAASIARSFISDMTQEQSVMFRNSQGNRIFTSNSFYVKHTSTSDYGYQFAGFTIFDDRLSQTTSGCGIDKESQVVAWSVANIINALEFADDDLKRKIVDEVNQCAGAGTGRIGEVLKSVGAKLVQDINKNKKSYNNYSYFISFREDSVLYNQIKTKYEERTLSEIVLKDDAPAQSAPRI